MMETSPGVTSVLKELENEEQVESLHYLVNKLPEIVSTMQIMEDKLTFLVDALSDKQSLGMIATEAEEKVGRLHLDESHMEAMIQLVQILPRLVPMVTKVEDVTLFIESVLGDEKTVDSLVAGLNDVIPLQKGAEIVQETNEHFAENKDTAAISMFGLLRMLKDPVVQKGLKYVESLLIVLNKKGV